MPKYDSNRVETVTGAVLSSLRKTKNCHKCGIKFQLGDKIRRGGRKGCMKMWHDACFKEY